MKCPHCGSINVPEGAAVCPSCKEPVRTGNAPAAQIKSQVMVSTATGSSVVGTRIETIGNAKIKKARIGKAQIINVFVNSPDADSVISDLSAKYGITIDQINPAAERSASKEAVREIGTIISAHREVQAKGISVSPASLYQLGLMAAYSKETQQAIRYFRETINADPGFTDAYRALALYLQDFALNEINRENFESAKASIQEADAAVIHINDTDSRIKQGYNAITMATMYEHRQMTADATAFWNKAGDIFNQIISIEPATPGALAGLGRVQLAGNKLDEAITLYLSAINLAPDYASAYNDLAVTYEEKMKTDSEHAKDWCRKARRAWVRTFALAKTDSFFSHEQRYSILEHIDSMYSICGDEF